VTQFSEDPYASIVELSKAFCEGSLCPSQVVAAQLDRIGLIDPYLGSYQQVYHLSAVRASKAADKLFSANQRIGPFHGIPFAIKDIYDFDGRVTSCGSWEMKDRISSQTGTILKRLLDAGGILVGKTKTVECALGGWGTNKYMGTPLNPWDLDIARVPGGSSSGSGVAVASGIAMCATGSDTGGSIRLPAAYCGLTGLKVSKACLPTDGIMTLSDTLDTPGPMARSVTDLILMFAVMYGLPSAKIDEYMVNGSGIFQLDLEILKGLKLGVLDANERRVCNIEILENYDAALELLATYGAKLEIFNAPLTYHEMADANGAITIYEGYLKHQNLYEGSDKKVDPHVRKRMLMGRDITSHSHKERLQRRQNDQTLFASTMEGYDALITPTIISPAPKLTEIDEDISPGHFTRPFNYIDMCALALPMARSRSGLPTSLQVALPAGQEMFALKLGVAMEAVLNIVERPNFNRF